MIVYKRASIDIGLFVGSSHVSIIKITTFWEFKLK